MENAVSILQLALIAKVKVEAIVISVGGNQVLGIDRATERARRIDVGRDVVDLVEPDGFRPQLVDGLLDQILIDVSDENFRSRFTQQPDELEADMPDPLDCVAVLADVFIAEFRVERCHQRIRTRIHSIEDILRLKFKEKSDKYPRVYNYGPHEKIRPTRSPSVTNH